MTRKTKQRASILRAIRESGRPLSPSEILNQASRQVESLGVATVYRVIKALMEDGLVVAVHLPGEPPRYESREAAARHHHHFRCDDCGRVFDVPGCARGVEQLAPPGFQIHGHNLLLFGRCLNCQSA